MSNIAAHRASVHECPANNGTTCFDQISSTTGDEPRHSNNTIIWSEEAFSAGSPHTPYFGVWKNINTRSNKWRIALRLTVLLFGLMFSLLFVSLVLVNVPHQEPHDISGSNTAHSALIKSDRKIHLRSNSTVYQCAIKIFGSLNHSASNPLRRRILC